MTFTRFLLKASKAISKAIPTRKGYRSAIAVCVAGLLAAVPPTPLLAQTPPSFGPFNISVQVGLVAMQLNITQPVPVTTPTGGPAVFHSILYIDVRDDSQPSAFHANVVATGEAADPYTLVGDFLPAVIRIMQDLQAGMPLQQAEADAAKITGVTVGPYHDGLTEYALILALIAILVIVALRPVVSPTFGNQLSAIQTKMCTGMAAIGISVPICSTSGTTIP